MKDIADTAPIPPLAPGGLVEPAARAAHELTRQEMEELARQLPDSDGEPLETPWHFAAIALLLDILSYLWRSRYDYFTGGNMFVYYSPNQRQDEDFKGPDFFFVDGVDGRKPRTKWVVWMEDNRFPDLIIEFLSSTTGKADLTTKKDLYEKVFRTAEYFCFDPQDDLLRGWRLQAGKYAPIDRNERGWMWSERLQLWLGTWEGTHLNVHDRIWLRFYDQDEYLVLTGAESERVLAEAAHLQHRQLELECRQLQKERHKADAALAEVVRLKALLADKGVAPE